MYCKRPLLDHCLIPQLFGNAMVSDRFVRLWAMRYCREVASNLEGSTMSCLRLQGNNRSSSRRLHFVVIYKNLKEDIRQKHSFTGKHRF